MSRRILMPVDDSPQSREAFEFVLTEHPDAEVVVLHVIDPIEWMTAGSFESGGYYDPERYEGAKKRGRKGISRIFLGSVAEAVLRRSSVPVTIFR